MLLWELHEIQCGKYIASAWYMLNILKILDGINGRLDVVEENNSGLEDTAIETIKS